MKSLIILGSLLFSLNSFASVKNIDQTFQLDNPEALEHGLPRLINIRSIEMINDVFNPRIRLIGTQNDEPFDIVRKVFKVRELFDGSYEVTSYIWNQTIESEACGIHRYVQTNMKFNVSRDYSESNDYDIFSIYRFTNDNCRSPYQTKLYNYVLMK